MNIDYSLLGLTTGETQVITLLKEGFNTPVAIAKHSTLSRQGIYKILALLQKRNLVRALTVSNHRKWELVPEDDFKKRLIELQCSLYNSSSSAQVTVYEGDDALKKLWFTIVSRKNIELIFIQSDRVYQDWVKVFGLVSINELNTLIKNNKIIVRAIMPEGNFERAVSEMGQDWAKQFAGRTYQAHLIDESYLSKEAELFMTRESVYFQSVKKKFVIEIKEPTIVKMLHLIAQFMQNYARTIDGNDTIKKLLTSK